ncbi:class I SAM-dependent methyltransferase [Nocardioides iriomotensis]|uniref:SAM-dependent methyltransferase n=1 Tax=Nocardioides iriomotensis TaxID=715784 RepID=A0A4Q5J507_9ACTN|nr:SAM-dependent methyltransferase [Nocardioides iriomotensis]RYU12699.1 SAM-dependent methyltransferase [Nocardioides iriomotensis]
MAAEPLLRALARTRGLLLDDTALVRAVASGRQKGRQPRWRRVELRYVDLKAGRRLQVTAYDDTQAHTSNHEPGGDARDAVDALLDEPFGNWHVETATETHQVRVTKKLEAMVHTSARAADAGPDGAPPDTADAKAHDRKKPRLLPEDHPVLRAIGIADEQGRVKPSRQAKYRQVEEFLRSLGPAVDDALASGRLRTPTADDPLRVVDLGCGNAYLTFAAHAYLRDVRGLPVHVVGVDVKQQSADHNTAVAEQLGIGDTATFVVGDIAGATLPQPPDVVLALHACDTATDDALARAVTWEAPLVLAAPCCHHDVAAQLRRAPTPAPYSLLTRHGILRERFADTLTDAVRAGVLRLVGYRVDVIEFVESKHTPRNTLLRAVRTGADASPEARAEYDDLVRTWGVHPALAERLHDRLL